jgi:phage head maturation protease
MREQKMYRVAAPSALIFRDENGDQTVEGLVVPYETWSEVDSVLEGHFFERFATGSLRKTFAETMRRAKGYFEHGRSRMFDRTPIMDLIKTWETPEGPWARASLLRGLPEWMIDGLRRGLYGFSLGAEPIKMERVRHPRRSAHNPNGIEERTYRELRAYDISLTPSPHYTGTTALLRSLTDEIAERDERIVVANLAKNPDRLVQLLREVKEAEPEHSPPEGEEAEQPEPPEDPESTEPVDPEEKPDESEQPAEPEPEGSRATQPPPIDYLAEHEEEEWQL